MIIIFFISLGEELEYRLRAKESILPQIHLHKEPNTLKQSTLFHENFFSQSLPNADESTSNFRRRAGTFSEFRSNQPNTNESAMSKNDVQPAKKAMPVPVVSLNKHTS